ncbi:hypothetical protein [Bacteroides acidifaciens]|nr:hypothetical protein [Bacteroides acidifaciens]
MLISFFVSALMVACSDPDCLNRTDISDDRPDDMMEIKDCIHLSGHEVVFDNTANIDTITTGSNIWYFTGLVDYDTYEGIYTFTSDSQEDERIFQYYWISYRKIGLNTIQIIVKENLTYYSRKIKLEVCSGNFYDHISIIQKGLSK